MLSVSFNVFIIVVSWTQAYTSQFIALVLFGLMMCEDKLSMIPRRLDIIKGLKNLPGLQTISRPCSLFNFTSNISVYCASIRTNDYVMDIVVRELNFSPEEIV